MKQETGSIVPMADEIKRLGGSENLVNTILSSYARGTLPHESIEEFRRAGEEAIDCYFDVEGFTGVILNELETLLAAAVVQNDQASDLKEGLEIREAYPASGYAAREISEGLASINLRAEYRSDSANIAKDFIEPCVNEAVRYQRAVGYFTSSALALVENGLKGFSASNGRMELVASPVLELDDIAAIDRGLKSRKDVVEASLLKAIVESSDSPNGLALLAWLVSEEMLEIRIAVPSKNSGGIYHEKIGIFTDSLDNSVAFTGSPNETYGGLANNFESLDVYWSWDDPHRRVSQKIENFNRLWSNDTKGIEIVELPQAVRQKLIEYRIEEEEEEEEEHSDTTSHSPEPDFPKTLNGRPYELFDHQREALMEWKAHDYQGIFRLATGAGKTLTAIHGAVSIVKQSNRKIVIVIAVPYQILADQWYEVLKLFNLSAIRCYISKTKWRTALGTSLTNLKLIPEKTIVPIIVVNRTLQTPEFQECLELVDEGSLFFIGDECHHHASEAVLKALPKARFKIGLSATPWSRRETERREMLQGYYGGIIADYSIEDAIEQEVLCPYEYHPLIVRLTEDEMENYDELSKRINQLLAIRGSGGRISEQELTAKLMARKRILGSANEKFIKLEGFLDESQITDHTLFYCGDGSVELDSIEEPIRDVERTSTILRQRGWKTSRFTAQQTYKQRGMIMQSFLNEHINAMVAIRVLDEGFDVPSCSRAFLLASSTNERQFIQRRGRILRRYPGKSKAVIYDFIVLPHENYAGSYGSSMVQSELYRFFEFARISLNSEECLSTADDIAQAYQVDLAEIENTLREAIEDGY